MAYSNSFFLIGGFLLLIGGLLGYFLRQVAAVRQANSIERKIKSRLESAKTEVKELISAAKDQATAIVDEAKNDEKQRKLQIAKLEEHHLKREESLDRRSEEVNAREQFLKEEINKLREAKTQIDVFRQKVLSELERISKLSQTQAKEELFKNLEKVHQEEVFAALQKIEKHRQQEIEQRAFNIMATVLQRYARSHVSELTTSAVTLPSDEMKGKIIGREGRNIRTLERLTGVEIIIDETPETITISSFDPLRREIAKSAIEKLIKDGRIQPARIEEKVEEATSEINNRIIQAGEAAVYEVGILDLPKEIIQLLGKLQFRTSYGQNVLLHSVESAHLAGMLASELGANVEVAKKGALLHDIGKAVDHEVEGTHLELGRKILKKYGVEEAVIKAMEPHHEDYPFATPEAFIVAAAEAISASRPGARRDTFENYLKRLEELERIAMSFEGVKTAYAVQAGRELRIFVVPEKIDDFGALKLARDIAAKIESELKYPGEIKVNVIREIRAVEYAR